MDLGCHVAGREADDVAGGLGVEAFQIEQHDLAVERPEPTNQLEQPIERATLIDRALTIGVGPGDVEVVNADKLRRAVAL